MSDRSYTVADMAKLIRPDADPDTVALLKRQLRHWTALDLLHPIAGKDTGTGRHRRYDADEVRRAAIFVELSRYRVPAPVLEDYATLLSETARSVWDAAISGEQPVLLCIGWNDAAILARPVGGPIDGPFFLTTDHPAERDGPAFDLSSAIVLNLTRLFRQLNL